jgi:sulfur-oxidizing protein SoxY
VTGDEVRVTVPATVDDGALVPVSVESSLPDTREILIVVEKNPIPLAARIRIPEGTEAFVSMRVKVAESGSIHALVRSGGQVYTASARTKVTLGGCS